MTAGAFKFEDCLLKHFIRHDVWLPRCKRRLATIRAAAPSPAKARRLRYFTFCAVGALDVLLLDREKVIRRSNAGEFDTVVFFDKDNEQVIETRKRIPGAVGFPGDFVEILQQVEEVAAPNRALDSPTNKENTRAVQRGQRAAAQLESFVAEFPFDVINLDVEQYIFRPREELPGKLTTAIRRILEWQKRSRIGPTGRPYEVDEFTLMFTTPVGPDGLPDEYVRYLRDVCLQRNLDDFPELKEPFLEKSKGRDVPEFFSEAFAEAFKLAVPKSLIEAALESDWHVVGGKDGVEVYQFDRPHQSGSYTMLHLVMTVRRQRPRLEKRAPGQKVPLEAEVEHKKAIRGLFTDSPISVESVVVDAKAEALQADLVKLFQHREKYYKEKVNSNGDQP